MDEQDGLDVEYEAERKDHKQRTWYKLVVFFFVVDGIWTAVMIIIGILTYAQYGYPSEQIDALAAIWIQFFHPILLIGSFCFYILARKYGMKQP